MIRFQNSTHLVSLQLLGHLMTRKFDLLDHLQLQATNYETLFSHEPLFFLYVLIFDCSHFLYSWKYLSLSLCFSYWYQSWFNLSSSNQSRNFAFKNYIEPHHLAICSLSHSLNDLIHLVAIYFYASLVC